MKLELGNILRIQLEPYARYVNWVYKEVSKKIETKPYIAILHTILILAVDAGEFCNTKSENFFY